MRVHRLLLAAVLLGLVVTAAAGCGSSKSSSRDVPASAAATVGDTTISKASLAELMAASKLHSTAKGSRYPAPGTAKYKLLQGNALLYLVNESELEQKLAALHGAPVTEAQIETRLAQVRAQLFGAQPSHYKKELKLEGITEKQLKQELHDELVRDHLYAKVTSETTVSNAELEEAYTKYESVYTRPSTRTVRQILVDSESLADELEKKLHAGASFAALAAKYSKDTASAAVGGRVTITQGYSVPEFEEVAFKLKTHEISEPVQTRYGWHIIEALGPTLTGDRTPLAAVKKQLRSSLLKTKKQAAWKSFLDDMKQEFAPTIHYQDGYTPPRGSSATAS
jgi:foldase protein PrsA